VTRAEFNEQCRKFCPHCGAIAVRRREDTREWVHDGSIAIPGTLGKRWSHTICLANDFRNEWEGKLNG
jgi:hypothetical protein